MCQLYANHFFNAVIHVGSVAPSCQKFILYNCELDALAAARNVPFISATKCTELVNGVAQPKRNFFKGIHYTKAGIPHFAGEVKRSLYRKDIRRPPNSVTPRPSPLVNPHQWPQFQLPSAMNNEFRKFFSMALACLPPEA